MPISFANPLALVRSCSDTINAFPYAPKLEWVHVAYYANSRVEPSVFTHNSCVTSVILLVRLCCRGGGTPVSGRASSSARRPLSLFIFIYDNRHSFSKRSWLAYMGKKKKKKTFGGSFPSCVFPLTLCSGCKPAFNYCLVTSGAVQHAACTHAAVAATRLPFQRGNSC